MPTKVHAPRQGRYRDVSKCKAGGATYTPKLLSDFVAAEMIKKADFLSKGNAIRILDPAVGEGMLLTSLLAQLPSTTDIEVHGFDTDARSIACAETKLKQAFPKARLNLRVGDFLSTIPDVCSDGMQADLFAVETACKYDLIIANPPYVRTQIMGAEQTQLLSVQFGLAGRVDLYYAFVLGIAKVLSSHGIAGIIVSNRFMTTRAGASVRTSICNGFNLLHVWDLGDTKLFDAAVLPAVILAEGRNGNTVDSVGFSSMYETQERAEHRVKTVMEALGSSGIIGTADGRRFRVQHGKLDNSGGAGGTWRIATTESDAWLATVNAHTWGTFGQVGKIRVGVKSCADDVFIRTDWDSLFGSKKPELLRPLMTHHAARQFKVDPARSTRQILYPHESNNGVRRAVRLDNYPQSKAYLEQHRTTLENRKYVIEAGRYWYELWVPQDPSAWVGPKLVFRDISESPCFWIDKAGSVVNGDCYWMTCKPEEEDLLWMSLAVGNSKFIESFYDHRFNNKLYSGRRRFMTQYVEQFPLPDPTTNRGKEIIARTKQVYDNIDSPDLKNMVEDLDNLVWAAFGLYSEEITG